jgi:hypothetical protein
MRRDHHADINTTDDDTSDEPLFEEASCGGDEDFVYDEDGSLALAQPIQPVQPVRSIQSRRRPCSLATLNGSWLLTLTPSRSDLPAQVRGPMRIEVHSLRMRISGDIYVRSLREPISSIGTVATSPVIAGPFVPGSLVIRENWYPAFPQSEYRWYFRSTGVTYSKGKLLFKFERHLWSNASQSFVSQDNGWMEFHCHSSSLTRPIGAPQQTIEMVGKAMVGGTPYNVTAVKTSLHYRGCLIEVDALTNRRWPASATGCDGGQTITFTGVYRAAGMDFRVVVNEINVPDDPILSTPEMHTLLTTHRSLSAGGDNWHLWLMAGSRMEERPTVLGIMFDTGSPPHREGAVGFYDPTLPNINQIHEAARGKKVGEVPQAFLRTVIHEAGHAFNLFHPKDDIHSVPVGTTIMNQTSDVIGFATDANPYPCNATMGFNDHNWTSLIHSPDPQVKPGWKEFGWGHGSAWSGVAEPVDAIGLDEGGPEASDLQLKVDLPKAATRGEFVSAMVTVTNVGSAPRDVTTALNLAEGDLRLAVTTPSGQAIDARDVVLLCGERRMTTLQPDESFAGTIQLFYGPHGLTFDQPGRYELRAELSVGDGTVVRREPVELVIHPATAEGEREIERLTMDKGVGISLALGDFGTDTVARDKLGAVIDQFAETETGAACAMVVANSLARDVRDIRNARVLRPKDEGEADRVLDVALQDRDAATIARLSTAIVVPRETAAPLLDMVQDRINRAREDAYGNEDKERAIRLIRDHLA